MGEANQGEEGKVSIHEQKCIECKKMHEVNRAVMSRAIASTSKVMSVEIELRYP